MKNKIFLDCGYHLGEGLTTFTKMLNINNKEWEVHAFEANPFCEMSQKVKQHLPIEVIPHEQAVWTENKQCYFNCESQKASASPTKNSTHLNDGWGSALTDINSAHSFEEQKLVEAINFSQFLLSFKGKEVYCKMDIEGAEFEVLRKMLKDNTVWIIKHLWVEWHDCDLTTENIETRKQLMKDLRNYTNVYCWY